MKIVKLKLSSAIQAVIASGEPTISRKQKTNHGKRKGEAGRGIKQRTSTQK